MGTNGLSLVCLETAGETSKKRNKIRFVYIKSARDRNGALIGREVTEWPEHARVSFAIIHYSLSIVAAGILVLWIVLYSVSDPGTHIGSFFGNAIVDWTGVVVMVLATKYFYERGSAESRPLPNNLLSPLLEQLRDHSLSIFLLLTGIGWAVRYARMNSEAKWGQVVGNIVSEWTQILGLVLMTKRFIERHSQESHR